MKYRLESYQTPRCLVISIIDLNFAKKSTQTGTATKYNVYCNEKYGRTKKIHLLLNVFPGLVKESPKRTFVALPHKKKNV